MVQSAPYPIATRLNGVALNENHAFGGSVLITSAKVFAAQLGGMNPCQLILHSPPSLFSEKSPGTA